MKDGGGSAMHKLLLAMALGLATAFPSGHALAGKDLDAVKARGVLICGVATGGLAGFMLADSQGKWKGLDVDVCRAVAAALFGDSEKVKYTPVSAQQGFTVNKKLGVKSAKELNGATVCVPSGSTTELNLADYFRANKMTLKPVVFDDIDQIRGAFFAGRCDVYTGDRVRLYATRAANAPNPDDYVILPEIISKEPLGPVVRHGDNQFADIVRWAQYAMIEAEEYGITSKNVDEMLKSDNPSIKRILGVTPGMGKALGVDEKWVYAIVKQVGNYGESFEKHVGPASLLK